MSKTIAGFIWDNPHPGENGEFRFVKSIASQLRTAFDLGGNVGDYSREILKHAPACRIIAFEPLEIYMDSLRFGGRIEAYNLAVGEYCGEVVIHRNQASLNLSSIHRINANTTPIIVHQTTLDETIRRLGISQIDLMKVDTEGNEINVFRGAAESLAKRVFLYIQFEYGYTYRDAGVTLEEAFRLLKSAGYSMGIIQPEAVIPCTIWDPAWENYEYSNWVASRKGF